MSVQPRGRIGKDVKENWGSEQEKANMRRMNRAMPSVLIT